MLKIRLLKTGRKNQPSYRIVVTDKRNSPQGGRFKEKLGFVNPFTKEKNLNEERIRYWLSVGAEPSDRVHNILIDANLIKGDKINVLKKKASSTGTKEESASTEEKREERVTTKVEEKIDDSTSSAEETKNTEKEVNDTEDKKVSAE